MGKSSVTMESTIAIDEVKRDLLEIVKERDQLRKEHQELCIELTYAKTIVLELEKQNLEMDRMLTIAHARLSEIHSGHSWNIAPKTFIGSWLSSPEEYPGLWYVEDLWRNGYIQQAYSQMPALTERKDFGVRHRINARLLFSAIIQSSSNKFQDALQWSEEALHLASEEQLPDLAQKAQFHRGLCYYFLGEYANARMCLILASHLVEYDQWISDYRQKTGQYLKQLPVGDPKRSVSPSFRFFCHSKLDAFIHGDSSV